MIELAEFISGLREELEKSAKKANSKKSGIVFKVTPIEVELTMQVEKSAEAGGKLSFKVFGIGAEANAGGNVSSVNSQKVKLTLTPKNAADPDADVMISGQGSPVQP